MHHCSARVFCELDYLIITMQTNPKYIPFDVKSCPLPLVVRLIIPKGTWIISPYRVLILAAFDMGVMLADDPRVMSYQALLQHYVQDNDTPCGVLVPTPPDAA